jgi:hypothetical protein
VNAIQASARVNDADTKKEDGKQSVTAKLYAMDLGTLMRLGVRLQMLTWIYFLSFPFFPMR